MAVDEGAPVHARLCIFFLPFSCETYGMRQRARVSKPALFESLCRAQGLSVPESEVRFHPVRKWRFDYAWREHKVALEKEGGVFMAGGGRHSRGAGFRADLEKYNTAAAMGWRVFRVLPEQLTDSVTFDLLKQAMP